MHANRGIFYMVAKGVGNRQEGPRIPIILQDLENLWVSLTFGGEEGSGRHLIPEHLDFLISMNDLVGHHLADEAWNPSLEGAENGSGTTIS